ncbi:MAG: HAMP domain-containing protein [Chloroflexi bacterium]|nr:HAMP domain-containing protein [Chloroflexota bacterium]
MGWFRRLGLQRRIMLYVAVGLALMVGLGAYGGLLAINQATELVYQERLGTAFTTATILDHNVQELANNVELMSTRLLRAESSQETQQTAKELLQLVSASGSFPLVRADSLWLIDEEGKVQLALPGGAEGEATAAPAGMPVVSKPTLLPPWSPSASHAFGVLLVPVDDDTGAQRWTVVLFLDGLNREQPYYVPPYVPASELAATADSPYAYRLEVLGPEGHVALTQGGKTRPGDDSPHWAVFQEQVPRPNGPFVFLHRPQQGQTFPPHVIAAVPLASGPFLLMLEQREDVALALPLRLRQRLILFATLGFVVTMLGAWVTTRHVVKPTEQLNVAAHRIARGEVETPINVAAQDEIGMLAESLETMRRRLQTWGSELERQVQERTRQLEDRNQELRVLYETLQQKEEHLRVLLGKVLGAQEEERKRVSRELHDEIGQALSALSMGLERLEQAKPEQLPALRGPVEALNELARDALSDLRRLAIALRPAALDDLGLVPAIRRYAELYLGTAGLDYEIREEGLEARLDPTLETVVYRVVQEAINNVARHSEATRARVYLRSSDGTLTATVEDNGQGFEPALATSGQGLGIQGMRERASLAGGTLTVDTRPGHGTTVRLEIPTGARTRGVP